MTTLLLTSFLLFAAYGYEHDNKDHDQDRIED